MWRARPLRPSDRSRGCLRAWPSVLSSVGGGAEQICFVPNSLPSALAASSLRPV
eukprot:COSAG04_NODE_12742_length_637_cov_1.146840_1_plen_53_part_10